jgi:cytochrome oxidase Cu insertion factor (SCO1/SenC/PrrC family)
LPNVRRFLIALAATALIAMHPVSLRAQSDSSGAHHISGLSIPDVELIDQHGKKVHFYSDLVKGKVVAINAIFTTCTTICPLMGAKFYRLGKVLGDDADKVRLISISIDPIVDTPERLEQWSTGFGKAAPDWTLLTGPKADVDGLLKALQIFTAEKQDHAPVVLIGGDGAGDWARASALLSPASLAEIIRARVELAQQNPSAPEDPLAAAAHSYFTDIQLITQNGDKVVLYSDLLKGKVVVINSFFGTCTGSCPKMSAVLSGLQERLGDHLGKDVFILSFSVDPETDTPAKLKEYAERFRARPGWLFLTGTKENVDVALSKLGQKVSHKEDHLTLFIVGNEKTGLWKKVAPGSSSDSLKVVVDSVLNDGG